MYSEQEPTYPVVGVAVDIDDLLYPLDLGRFFGNGLAARTGDETGDGATELLGGRDGGEGGDVQPAIALFEDGE